MTRLDAPAMSRQLAVACRRSNPARRRRWWPFAARAHSREADSWVNLSLRLPVTGWCAYLGGLAVQQPRASGLLEVLTVVLVQARVTHMRSRLEQSDDLAQPAQLPVAGADVFDLQLRAKLWRKACWPACDATAFWSIYWHASNISGMWLWPWLPIIAATYALMIVAAALVCYRFRVSPGFLPTAILEAAAVILAKQLDFGWIKDGIDMVVLIADWTADPRYVAADLISQAEHSPGASILITWEIDLIDRVADAIDEQLARLSRGDLARDSLERFGALIKVKDEDEAVALSNLIAPEHLHVSTSDPSRLAERLTNAGAIFLGHDAPVAVGDYAAGPSHVLPTGGTARWASGLCANDFLKRTSLIYVDRDGLAALAPDIRMLADKEGLTAHRYSVDIRLEDPEDQAAE